MTENSPLKSDSYRLQEIETELINSKSTFRRETISFRFYIALTVIFIVLLIFHYSAVLNSPIWLVLIYWVLAIIFFLATLGTDLIKVRAEVDAIEAKKAILLGFSDGKKENTDYFDTLVKINVENLAAYYSLVKTHSSQSFKVSIVVSTFGFALIVVGLIIGFQYKEQNLSYIATGAGLIIEFISGVLFYLYNKTVRQLKDYHDSLINVQNVLLSFKLIESTTQENMKADMITKMIEYLVGKKTV